MAKTVPVKPHRRTKPSTPAPKKPNYPKPGPKTVPVKPHRRKPPKQTKQSLKFQLIISVLCSI